MDTKVKIIEEAKKMFNERGYSQVSLRDIANAVGIAIGNLTYYFKKKEDLLNTIVEELQNQYFIKFFHFSKEEDVLCHLIQSFQNAAENRMHYKFYYENLNELSHQSAIVHKKLKQFQSALYDYYMVCFSNLREQEIVRKELLDSDLAMLSCLLIDFSASWGEYSSPFSNFQLYQGDYVEASCSILLPYLTEGAVIKIRTYLNERRKV